MGRAGPSRPVPGDELAHGDFIEAAKVQGLPAAQHDRPSAPPERRPVRGHQFLLAVTGAIYAEVGLFLLGVAPAQRDELGDHDQPGYGQGALYTNQSVLYLFSPMVAIVFLQVALVFFARAWTSSSTLGSGCSNGTREVEMIAAGAASVDGNGTVVEVDNLTISFGRLKAVEEVSLLGGEGEVYAVVGESGCGKSTLAYSLLTSSRRQAASPRVRCATGAGT